MVSNQFTIVYMMYMYVYYMQAIQMVEDNQPHNEPIHCVTGVEQQPVAIVSQAVHSHIPGPVNQPHKNNTVTIPFQSLWSASDPN